MFKTYFSELHKANLSKALSGIKNPFYGKKHSVKSINKINANRFNLKPNESRSIVVKNIKTNKYKKFPSIMKTALHFDTYFGKINRVINNNTIFKGKYIIYTQINKHFSPIFKSNKIPLNFFNYINYFNTIKPYFFKSFKKYFNNISLFSIFIFKYFSSSIKFIYKLFCFDLKYIYFTEYKSIINKNFSYKLGNFTFHFILFCFISIFKYIILLILTIFTIGNCLDLFYKSSLINNYQVKPKPFSLVDFGYNFITKG